MVNDNNNLMDGYILLHAWDAAYQTPPQSAVILPTSRLTREQRGDVSAPLSVALPPLGARRAISSSRVDEYATSHTDDLVLH